MKNKENIIYAAVVLASLLAVLFMASGCANMEYNTSMNKCSDMCGPNRVRTYDHKKQSCVCSNDTVRYFHSFNAWKANGKQCTQGDK